MKTATLDRLHGIALIALMSLSAFYIAGIPEVKALSLSPLIVGIIIGMIYANTLRCRMPKVWEPGIKFCTKRLLRLGIILLGKVFAANVMRLLCLRRRKPSAAA